MKKNILFRTVAIGLAAVLMIAAVTACGSNPAGTANVTAAEDPNATTAPQEEGSAAEDSDETGITLEKQTIPYVKLFDENSTEETVDFYYVNGGDIPYVSVSDFMSILSEVMKFRKLGDVSYTTAQIEKHFFAVTRPDNESAMMLDAEEDIIYLADFNRFVQAQGVDALVAIMDIPDTKDPDVSDLTEKFLAAETEEERLAIAQEMEERSKPAEDVMFVSAGSSINRTGSSKTLKLSEYMIDIVDKDGECYVPFQTLNDLFMCSYYLQFVFNGEKLYGFEYGSDPDPEIYDVEPQEMSQEFANYNLNELCLLFDCFYGLKDEHDIDSFANVIYANQEIQEGLSSTDSRIFDSALRKFISQFMDDGHSVFSMPSRFGGSLTDDDVMSSLEYYGLAINNSQTAYNKFSTARSAAYPDGVPMYEEIGDTAFITFDSFICSSDEDFSKYYDPDNAPDPATFVLREEEQSSSSAADLFSDPEDGEETAQSSEPAELSDTQVDTIWLLIYANRMIRREGSPIKNVVVDLSLNGGGQSSAALFAMSLLTGQAQIGLKDTFTSAETIMTITADVNLDNIYDKKTDSLINDFNVYVLTSPVSFSCGNLVPAACRMAKNVTLVGQQSGGGSCVVFACTTASGAAFQMSGTKQLAVVKNGSYYNIDQGIVPDIVLTRPESFYDRAALADYLKNCK